MTVAGKAGFIGSRYYRNDRRLESARDRIAIAEKGHGQALPGLPKGSAWPAAAPCSRGPAKAHAPALDGRAACAGACDVRRRAPVVNVGAHAWTRPSTVKA